MSEIQIPPKQIQRKEGAVQTTATKPVVTQAEQGPSSINKGVAESLTKDLQALPQGQIAVARGVMDKANSLVGPSLKNTSYAAEQAAQLLRELEQGLELNKIRAENENLRRDDIDATIQAKMEGYGLRRPKPPTTQKKS